MLVLLRLAVLVLALAAPAMVEAAIDCRGATPLPDDLVLAASAADVPESLATGPAKHTFRGTLTLAASSLNASREGCAAIPWDPPAGSLAFSFFTQGEYLVPVNRDFVPPAGRVLLSPGRVWSEPSDSGMSRASFPFALVNPINNATHNGIATFLFDDRRVSALRVQVVQETALWAKVDLWDQVPMTYTPDAPADEVLLRAQFAEELQRQTPIRPWSSLPASPALAAFDGDAASLDISANGLVVDGVLYLRGCHTRYGPFPYCRQMRHGVFSVTKSAAGAVALLRLAQKYGDGVLAEKLVDYLPAGLAHSGWDRVTFADALSMATGAVPDDVDLGRWTISADGRVCRAWTKWDNGLPRCYAIYREGEAYAFEIPERFTRVVARRTPGGLEP